MPLLVDHPRPGVARLLLDRPERHNALDRALVEALHSAVEAERANVIVLGSSGSGRFCGGADTSLDDAERAWVSEALYELYARILELPRPVLAALDGPAIGGGLQLAITCDLRIAAPGAWLAARGPGHGLAVAAWGLPGLIGRSRALDLCLTGRRVDTRRSAGDRVGRPRRAGPGRARTHARGGVRCARRGGSRAREVDRRPRRRPHGRARRGGRGQPRLVGHPAAPMTPSGRECHLNRAIRGRDDTGDDECQLNHRMGGRDDIRGRG